MAAADDLHRLNQRNARGQHRGQLTAEYGDIARRDLGCAREQALALFANPRWNDALAAQVGTNGGLVHGHALAFDFLAAPVRAFPDERRLH